MPPPSRSAVSTDSATRARLRAHREPVHHDVDVVAPVTRELRRGVQLEPRAVDARPQVALPPRGLELLAVLPLAAPHERGEQRHPFPGGPLEHGVGDLLHALALHHVPAVRAVLDPEPGEQQPQVVVDLGDGPDGGPGVAAGCLLVDGDGRRQTFDLIHVRLVHLAQELPGIGRKRLDVAALAFGEDGIERQG